MKTTLTTTVIIGISIVLFEVKFSSQSNLIFIYFLRESFEFVVIDLIKSLILINSSRYVFIFYLL